MMHVRRIASVSVLVALLLIAGAQSRESAQATAAADPLPSWNEGATKKSIIDFVKRVTTPGKDFVPVADRIATFDNDGTLWCEKPLPEGLFVLERAKKLIAAKPELKERQPFKALIEKDKDYFHEHGEAALVELVTESYGNITVEDFQKEARAFAAAFKHPKTEKPLKGITYQPQLELLKYLRDNDFTVWICSGGTIDFIRCISEDLYGVAPHNVIGTTLKTEVREMNGRSEIWRLPELDVFNDKAAKPPSIARHIGKRPILTCGNEGAGGDIAMLAYTQGSTYPSLQLIVNHDDKERETEYAEKDNKSLETAKAKGWTVISMKGDWKEVFAK